jgi:hypothetical protein
MKNRPFISVRHHAQNQAAVASLVANRISVANRITGELRKLLILLSSPVRQRLMTELASWRYWFSSPVLHTRKGVRTADSARRTKRQTGKRGWKR